MTMPDFEARGRHIRLPVEIRAGEDGQITVEGYAAVFNERADIGGFFVEQIAPGAFASSIARGDDVVFLINHEGLPLARTRSGTLDVREDQKGLHVRSELDADDPDVARIARKMARGDLDKMSFAFRVRREEWDESGEVPVRTLREVDLHDVSIVTTPAYDGTEIGLRSLERARADKPAPMERSSLIGRRMKMEQVLRGLR